MRGRGRGLAALEIVQYYHHVVFDNGAHDSTGSQPTASPAVDFAVTALACGYRYAETVSDRNAFVDALSRQVTMEGPTLPRTIIHAGARKDLGRPKLESRVGYLRFATFLGGKPWSAEKKS